MPILDFKSYLKNLSEKPGVYQLLDDQGVVLYVGKARNLKKRVSQYFHKNLANPKTFALMQQVDRVEVIVTQSETEALLLENSLIKEKKPRYNILLKDDKSYPYLCISKGDFPRLDFYRGNKDNKGLYFGPYPSARAVRETLNLLQKLFKIRQCHDTFFKNRKRPCLQYHIDRCTAPCTQYVTPEAYQQQVKDAVLFLEGKRQSLVSDLEKRMKQESEALRYEKAGALRDQIAHLKTVQEKQYVVDQSGDSDVVTLLSEGGVFCIGVLKIREGHLLDRSAYFPKVPESMDLEEILSSFLSQYYLNKVPMPLWPKKMVLNLAFETQDDLASLLSEKANKKMTFHCPKQGKLYGWLKWGLENTKQALQQKLAGKVSYSNQLRELQVLLGIALLPKRIECFDISHSSGESPVASNVVFGLEGPIKSEYRHFNITNITKGDDYGAMKEALSRRYAKVKETGKKPNLILVDGGKGQLNIAVSVLKKLGLTDILLVGVAKGEGRKPGLEKLFLPGKRTPISLLSDSTVLHLIQRIRDEAHRFAIVGHRHRRDKKRSRSFLEDIPGVGPKRRRLLITKFNGLQGLKKATIEEIANLPGFNLKLAKQIYQYLEDD